MDGLLIDSEPHWRRAEMEAFARVGLTLTEDMCLQTTGLRIDAVVDYWFSRAPWKNKTHREVADDITTRVAQLIETDALPLEGVEDAIALFEARGLPIGLCSSSPRNVIDAALRRLALTKRFSVVCSADGEAFGKPHPAVYLKTATMLGVAPETCLALEDSMNGCISAKAARMKVIAVPEAHANRSRFAFCDAVISSLKEVTPELFARLSVEARA